MPDTSKRVHYCKKCGKPMEYKEKSMLYIYDVAYKPHKYSTDYVPEKRYAINLCEECSKIAEKMIKQWTERTDV